MKAEMNASPEPIVLEAVGLTQNLNDWNICQNAYNIKEAGPVKAPKSLIRAALRELREFCAIYHIDPAPYRYLRVSKWLDTTWQVDFHVDENETGPHISVWDIHFNSKSGQIRQSCIGINGRG